MLINVALSAVLCGFPVALSFRPIIPILLPPCWRQAQRRSRETFDTTLVAYSAVPIGCSLAYRLTYVHSSESPPGLVLVQLNLIVELQDLVSLTPSNYTIPNISNQQNAYPPGYIVQSSTRTPANSMQHAMLTQDQKQRYPRAMGDCQS